MARTCRARNTGSGGSPPSGITLNSNGTLSGTPTVATSTTFSVQVTDSTTPTSQSVIKALSITVGAQLSITTTTLPDGLQSSAYSQTLAASGGTPGYWWNRVAFAGERDPGYSEVAVSAYMRNPEILIAADLGLGDGSATVWTTDLTAEYVAINADYRS